MNDYVIEWIENTNPNIIYIRVTEDTAKVLAAALGAAPGITEVSLRQTQVVTSDVPVSVSR